MRILKNANRMPLIIILFIVIIFFIQFMFLGKLLKYDEDNNSEKELHGDITFVSNRTDKKKELNKIIEEFEKIHPNVNVNLELIGDAEEILERKASVGEMADVTLVPGVIETKEFYKYLLPIDDLGFNKEKIYDYSSGVGEDGKLYALTSSQSWHGVIYNKKIFEDLGINKLPVSEEEFFEVCRKIKSNGIVPVALNCRQSWIMSMWIDTIPYLYNINLEEDMLSRDRDILDSESAIYKGLNFAREIYSNGYCEENPLNYEWRQCKEDMANGKIAMTIWNSDFVYQLEDLGLDKYSIGMFPLPETKLMHMIGDYKIGISKNTKYPEASKEFFKYLFEEDRYAKAINVMSNSKESIRTKETIEGFKKYNLPILFQESLISNKSDNDNKIHEKYYNLKNCVGLDYKFAQSYITTDKPEDLRDSINSKWREGRDK